MFLLKVCSSSHSCCLGLAGLTNARLVLSSEWGLSHGVSGTHTHTVPSSCFSFTFNTTRERQRGGQKNGVLKKNGVGGSGVKAGRGPPQGEEDQADKEAGE